MRHRSWLQCAPALVCLLAASGTHAADATQKLHALFDDSWQRSLREDPIAASTLGDHRYDALWPDYSDDALAKQAQQDRAAIALFAPRAHKLVPSSGSTAISTSGHESANSSPTPKPPPTSSPM